MPHSEFQRSTKNIISSGILAKMERSSNIIFQDNEHGYDYYFPHFYESTRSTTTTTTTSTSKPAPAPAFPSTASSKSDSFLNLTPTALVFIGISAFTLLSVFIAGLYFLWKSRLSPAEEALSKTPTKGRGVTRPSFLPNQHNQYPDSIHLDIPSPDWTVSNYPIQTPYSFSSTSTVGAGVEAVRTMEEELPSQEIHGQMYRKEPRKGPVKPARGGLGIGQADGGLPANRATVS